LKDSAVLGLYNSFVQKVRCSCFHCTKMVFEEFSNHAGLRCM